MKKKKIIAIICVTAATISVIAGGCYLWQKNKSNSKKVDCYSEEQLGEIENVKSNIEVSETMETIEFENYEELEEYTDKLFDIDLEEATMFINSFLEECENNVMENMLVYYNETIWDSVIADKLFPSYDANNVCYFEFNNVVVEETGVDNKYKVTYSLNIGSNSTGEIISVLDREDYFTLYKEFGYTSIIDYERHTK